MALQLPSGVPLSEIPSGPPPPGVTSNFAHPSPTLQPALITVPTVFMTIGLAVGVLNLIQHRRDFRLSDWIVAVSCVITTAYTGLVISLSYIAVHPWDVSLATLNEPRYYKLVLAQAAFNVVANFIAKAGIIALYLQVFNSHQSRWVNPIPIACYFALFLDVCTYFPSLVSTFYYLTPGPGQHWGLDMGPHISKDVNVGLARSATSTLLDLYLFILPIQPILKLKIAKKKKLGILAIFGTALLGVVASVLSLSYCIIALHSPDSLWYYAVVELCNAIETWVAIIVASMPGFAAFYKVTLPVFAGRLTSTLASLLSSRSRAAGSVLGGFSNSRSESTLESQTNHPASEDSSKKGDNQGVVRKMEVQQSSG